MSTRNMDTGFRRIFFRPPGFGMVPKVCKSYSLRRVGVIFMYIFVLEYLTHV